MKERKITGFESLNEIWNDIFLNAMYTGKIYIEEDDLHMEYNGVDNIIKSSIFKNAFKDTLKNVYKDNIYPVFQLKSFSSEQVETMCLWLNPELEKIGMNEFKEYKKEFVKRFCEGEKNYSVSATNLFRLQLRNTLMSLKPEKRQEMIEYILPYNILKFSDLVALGYYKDIPRDSELNKYRDENGEFSEDIKQALANLSVQKIVELKDSKHKPTRGKIKKYTQYISSEILIDMVEFGQIPYEYLEYSNVTKKDLFSLKYEVLLLILENIEKYPKKLRITSQDILDEYGKTVNGSKFYKLAIYGYVDNRQVIDVISKNKVLRLSGEPEENLFEDEEVLAFYSSTRLSEMLLEDDIDVEFVEKYKEALNDEKVFKKKSETTMEQVKFNIMTNSEIPNEKKEDRVQETLLKAYDIDLCIPEVLKENISREYLEQQYLAERISDVYILDLYVSGAIDSDIIKNYFSEKEIFGLYLQGKVDRNIISTFENREELSENIEEAIMNNEMPLGDVVALYFNGTLTIENLAEVMEFSEVNFNFSTCIDENTDFSKIKEMFEKRIIDYNCVTNLKDTGIITEEQLEELKQTMDKQRFFDELKGKIFKLVTDRRKEERKKGRESGYSKPKKDDSEKYNKEKKLISKILGIDDIQENFEEYATIESYDSKGKVTSLNGYKVFGSRDNGLVIFAKFQKENAVFIMPFYQAVYFLDVRGQEGAKDVIIQDRMKDKAYLRKINQVEVIMHKEYFARNLTEAACRLSSEFEERFTGDEKYRAEVEELCKEMRTDYREGRGLE